MRIFVVTDAWEPQVNGVVRTLTRTVAECRAMGHDIEVVSPNDGYVTMPLPTYDEIKLALFAQDDIEDRFKAFEPEAVHIATEGPLGLAARTVCLKHRMPFSTSYHTKFPEYVAARRIAPEALGYAFVRWFHRPAGKVMVATPSMQAELQSKGFINLTPWSRGVDTDLFHPAKRAPDRGPFAGLATPVLLYVGRVAVEKNIEAFLRADAPGSKVVVGDGPQRRQLEADYPDAVFLGAKFADDLARHFANADVFVFPSLTDTFGLVILEAMATGTPVAGYVAPGPRDIIPGSGAGAVDDDLAAAIRQCLTLDRTAVRAYAEKYSWRACAEEFVRNLSPLPPLERRRLWSRLRKLRPPRFRRRQRTVDPAA
jgi:glycosyltransferase involved in cell wall biosynthesis